MKKLTAFVVAFLLMTGSAFAVMPCASAAEVEVESSADEFGVFEYTVLNPNKGEIRLDKYKGSAVEFSTDKEINGKKIVEIGNGAFYGNQTLKTVTITNNVKAIGNNAFRECSSLEKVTVGSEVQSIPEYCFYQCSSLKTVSLPNSVTEIGISAFYNHCPQLKSRVNVCRVRGVSPDRWRALPATL